MILSCKEASRLASQGLDRRLRFSEQVRLRAHLVVCAGCTHFSRQIQLLRKAAQRLGT